MMKYEELTELINHLDQSSLAFMDYQTDDEHIILSKEVPQMVAPQNQGQASDVTPVENNPVQTPVPQEVVNSAVNETNSVDEEKEAAGEVVESPMVGVIYLILHHDEEPDNKVGDQSEQADVIRIVETMKLMNEIQAPHSGDVTEILVEIESLVEYKHPLISIY